MNVSDYKKRVKEMIEKTQSDSDKKGAGAGKTKRSAASQKDFDDAKVGMTFLILRNVLRATEAAALWVNADLTGLEDNCMTDALFVRSWEAYAREALEEREFSPGMMVLFCLTSQSIYTLKNNMSKKKGPEPDQTTPDVGQKRGRQTDSRDQEDGDTMFEEEALGDDSSSCEDDMHDQPPARKRQYTFDELTDDELDSDMEDHTSLPIVQPIRKRATKTVNTRKRK